MVVYQSRARKRIHAIPLAPDGSAFRTCENCELTVAIALADMHECGFEKNRNKRLKTQCRRREVERQKIVDQPRSAYSIFMEEFMKTCKDGNEIEIDKKGYQIWKNMTNQERHPFVLVADKLNWAYMKLLWDEENEIQRVDDEADSAQLKLENLMSCRSKHLVDLPDPGSSTLHHMIPLTLKSCCKNALGQHRDFVED